MCTGSCYGLISELLLKTAPVEESSRWMQSSQPLATELVHETEMVQEEDSTFISALH